MRKKYSVIIIGAGLAGIMAARELSKSCSDFLVIDAKQEIGLPLKCGEGVRKENFLELFGSADYPFIKNKAEKLVVVGGKTTVDLPVEYLVLDRPAFEAWLSEPVKQKILLNTKCIGVSFSRDSVEVETDKGEFIAEVVILAHGCNYSVQKSLRLLDKQPLMIPCYGGVLRNHGLDTKSLYFFFNDKKAFCLWVFPKDKDNANIGLGVEPHFRRGSIKQLFKEAIEEFVPGVKGKPSYSGVYPSTGPIKKTYSDRVLVCGNAAGQVFAGIGEGIYFALKSGKIAGATAASAISKRNFSSKFLKTYELAWKKAFGKNLEASKAFAAILFLGFKYWKMERLFAFPTQDELMDLCVRGKVPLKAKAILLTAKALNLFSSKSRKIPLILKLVKRFV